MAVTVSTQGPFFTTGSISWSDIREQFRAANIDGTFSNDTAPISVSELYRNTSLALTNPIVPDCTENRASGPLNNGVPESGSFAISRMRNTIKFYFLNQTGTDLNLDLDAQNYNGNINRNIRKRFRINGTCGSNNNGAPAASFNATATNVRLELMNDSDIIGAAGPNGVVDNGQGQPGGAALSLQSAGGNNNVVFLNPTTNVYGGGGGGDGGAAGTDSSSSQVTWGGSATSSTSCFPNGQCITVCDPDGGAQSCKNNKPIGMADNQISGCQSGYDPPSCACGSCLGTLTITVDTAGSNGRTGRGFNNPTASLVALPSGGGTATSGGNGGNFGQPGNGANNAAGLGGAGGASIAGSNWTVTGTQNATTQQGSTI